MISLNDYINEGLIYSYDPYRVIDLIKDKFNFIKYNDINLHVSIDEYDKIDYLNNDKKQEDTISINVNSFINKQEKEDNELKNEVDEYVNKLGWYFSHKYDKENVYIYYPKFQFEINNKVHKNNKYLYHYTLKDKKDKILKFGLVPKHNKTDSNFKYRNSIHLIKDNLSDEYILKIKKNLFYKIFTQKDEIICIKINISKLNINFYIDPNFREFGYVTYDNIHPKYIDSIKDYEIY